MKNFLLKPMLFCLALASILHAEPILYGGWNNKLWDKKTLKEGVKKGDKDALAEWAYCSDQVFNGIPYDFDLIFKRSQKAAEKGSILGKYMLGYCYVVQVGGEKNRIKGVSLMREAMDAGHPLAKWNIQVLERMGKYVKKDTSNMPEKMNQRLKEGVWAAHKSLGTI